MMDTMLYEFWLAVSFVAGFILLGDVLCHLAAYCSNGPELHVLRQENYDLAWIKLRFWAVLSGFNAWLLFT